MSFFEMSTAPGEPNLWVGGKNWVHMFYDDTLKESWILLAKYSSISLVVEFLLGFAIALLLQGVRYENFFLTIFIMPMMMAPSIVGWLYLFLYNASFGWYFWFLNSLGFLVGGSILGNPDYALYGVIIADVWQWTPLIILILSAGLKKIPLEQVEAAKVDGAGPIRRFFDITLPNMSSIILVAVLLRLIDNMRYIDIIYITTTGGPANATKILPMYLFNVAIDFFELGRAAAIGLTLLVVTIILANIFIRVFRKRAVIR